MNNTWMFERVTVDEEGFLMLRRVWGESFRCYLCGHMFAIGDQFRGYVTSDYRKPDGTFGSGSKFNPLVCEACDTPDVLDKWNALVEEWEKLTNEERFWSFKKRAD